MGVLTVSNCSLQYSLQIAGMVFLTDNPSLPTSNLAPASHLSPLLHEIWQIHVPKTTPVDTTSTTTCKFLKRWARHPSIKF